MGFLFTNTLGKEKKQTNRDAFNKIKEQSSTFRQNEPMRALLSQISYILAYKTT
jgi:hypothetical protein